MRNSATLAVALLVVGLGHTSALAAPHRRVALRAASSDEPAAAPVNVWESMKKDELVAHARRRGLKVSGTKAALVERLDADKRERAATGALAATPGGAAAAPERVGSSRTGFIDGTLREATTLTIGGAEIACHAARTGLAARETGAGDGIGGGAGVLVLRDVGADGAFDADGARAAADEIAFATDAYVLAVTEACGTAAPRDVFAAFAAHAADRNLTATGLVAGGRFADAALDAPPFDAVVAVGPSRPPAGDCAAPALVFLAAAGGEARAVAFRDALDACGARDYVVRTVGSLDETEGGGDGALLADAWLQLYLARDDSAPTSGPRAKSLWV